MTYRLLKWWRTRSYDLIHCATSVADRLKVHALSKLPEKLQRQSGRLVRLRKNAYARLLQNLASDQLR